MKILRRPGDNNSITVTESRNPQEVLMLMRECAGNITEVARRDGRHRKVIEAIVHKLGFDKLVEDEILDELEAKLLQASLGTLKDPKFNTTAALSVLAKRRPSKWSGRKNAEPKAEPKPYQPKKPPYWKKRAENLRPNYGTAPGGSDGDSGSAAGNVLPTNTGRQIFEPNAARRIREPD